MTDLGFLRRIWPDMCAAYRDIALGQACLDLQEKFGADVPLLLLLCIADRVGSGIGPDQLEALIVDSQDWRETVIQPLRRVRQAMRGGFTAAAEIGLRDDIRRLELEAERLHVRRLAEAFPVPGANAQSAAPLYLAMLGAPAEAASEFLETFNLAYDAQVSPAAALLAPVFPAKPIQRTE